MYVYFITKVILIDLKEYAVQGGILVILSTTVKNREPDG